MPFTQLTPASVRKSATLTLSRRFDLCFGRRLGADLDERTALEQYGPVATASHGSGVNPRVRIEIGGDVDSRTGMIANLVDIKSRFGDLLNARYDHKMLNADTPPFDNEPPTIERITQQIFTDSQAVAIDEPYDVVGVDYAENRQHTARLLRNRLQRTEWFDLSAARETSSPHLSATENRQLFGVAARLHGHGYEIGLTMEGEVHSRYGQMVSHANVRRVVTDIQDEFDHQSLNELRAFRGRPTTTESFSRILFQMIASTLPLTRLTVRENRWLSAATDSDGTTMTLRDSFQALHRLHRPELSASENAVLYGKCNHPNGHGHDYHVALTIRAPYHDKNGTIVMLETLRADFNRVLARFRHRYLDLECEEFSNQTSTGEVIARVLWQRLEESIGDHLERVVLDETPNNRFIVSRDASEGA